MARITAIFDDRSHAEQAITELRRRGVPEADISVISRRPDDIEVPVRQADAADTDAGSDTGSRIGKGALAGAGVGTLFGLAAALIPGVGPFIAAGTLAGVLGATGGAAAAGAIVGGTSGAIAGAFARAGYDRDEAEHYAGAVERGDVLVAVDAHPSNEEFIRAELARQGGRTFRLPTGGMRDSRDAFGTTDAATTRDANPLL